MEEKILFKATVSLLVKERKVVLAKKTRKIGAGCWNGYGGGIEIGETIIGSAGRELFDESEVETIPENFEKVAIMDYHNTNTDGTSFICRVHFYIVRDWKGEPKESDEMANPKYFDVDNLPFDDMMPADRLLFPLIFSGKKIIGSAKYGPFQKELLEFPVLTEVDFLPED